MRSHRMAAASRPLWGSSRITTAGIADQRGGQAEALPHAERHLPGREVGDVADADDLEHPVHRRARGSPLLAATTAQVPAGGAAGVDGVGGEQGTGDHAAGRSCSRKGRPPMSARPEVRWSMPRIARSSVDLPAPLGPRNTVTRPGSGRERHVLEHGDALDDLGGGLDLDRRGGGRHLASSGARPEGSKTPSRCQRPVNPLKAPPSM